MTGRRSSRPPRGRPALRALALVPVLLLAACEADPARELEDAVAATVAQPVAFDLTARADRAALDELGAGAADAAAFLEGFAVTGTRAGDGRTHLAVSIGGTAPLLEAIVVPDAALLLRTGLGELLGVEGADPERELGPALDELGVDPEGRDALVASFRGGWVAVTGLDDLGELLDADGRAGAGSVLDLQALLAATRVTGARDAGEVRRLDVEVAAAVFAPLLGEPEDPDEVLPGTVVLRDGVVLEVRLDLSPGSDTGTVEVILTLSDHGVEPDLEPPEPDATLSRAQLLDLLARLQAATDAP